MSKNLFLMAWICCGNSLSAQTLYDAKNPKDSPYQAEDFYQTEDSLQAEDTLQADSSPPRKPLFINVKTNLLYDALLFPNIGMEFYLGKGYSLSTNWLYGWWKKSRHHWYWRAYGGEIDLRKWWGKAAEEKPTTGHHIGIYAQMFTYDFQTGGRGYMGGKPGGTLWDKMNYAVGAEYGYSLPVAKNLNIDFAIGVGYWGGIYHEYLPQDGRYAWQSTKNRRWLGPTKAEVSLVWLIGKKNQNRTRKMNSEKMEEESKREVPEKKEEDFERKQEDIKRKQEECGRKGGCDE